MLLTKTFLTALVISLLSGLVVLGPTGCQTAPAEDANTEPKQPALVSSTLVGEFTAAQLKTRYASQSSLLSAFIRNGVKVYQIVYNTTNTDGTAIKASGALLVPDVTTPVPLLSVQHGTITSDDQAPSYYKSSSEAYQFGTLFASLGYIISAPDYIGYGVSNNLPHTYEHRAGLATASYDMLLASREFIAQQKTNWDKRLFLGGYSEGGYATLSLQKFIEEQHPNEFNLVASSCGAGAYDKTAFMKQIVNNKSAGDPSYNRLYVWVLLTYDRIYGLNRPMSYYFKEPYASQIQSQRENARISVSLDQTFTDSFKKALNDGTDTAFLKAVADNDVYDWRPKVLTRLYHGTADDLVLPLNSINAEAAMQKRGAPNVKYQPIEGGNHSTSLLSYILSTYSLFQTVQ